MDFLGLAAKRCSVRGYLDRAVEREKIERCLEAARLAPSACNSQPWKFVVIDAPELRGKVAKLTFGPVLSFNHFSMTAPVLVLLIAERPKLIAKIGGKVKRKNFTQMDIAIAAEHFCLAAAEQGLGTCIMGWFDEKAAKNLLKIPPKKRIELIITAGYPDPEYDHPKKRKNLNDIRSYNRY
ncbi:MAG: nitroreductase family protein [Planctomycetes bacterium]|nr:nitroreductase family protein [Planctomycetota bacterium]